MASSSAERADTGFATPAAVAISLAVAVIAAAVTSASVAALRRERANLDRTTAEYALEADQARAALTLLGNTSQSASNWTLGDESGTSVEVVAEPEAAKVGLAEASKLTDADFARLKVTDADALKDRLASLSTAARQTVAEIGPADASPAWRLCSRSAVSPAGTADHLPSPAPSIVSHGAIGGRVGQLWRIRIATAGGWVDDRVVRFTGRQAHPVDVVADSFGHGQALGETCARLLAGAPA